MRTKTQKGVLLYCREILYQIISLLSIAKVKIIRYFKNKDFDRFLSFKPTNNPKTASIPSPGLIDIADLQYSAYPAGLSINQRLIRPTVNQSIVSGQLVSQSVG